MANPIDSMTEYNGALHLVNIPTFQKGAPFELTYPLTNIPASAGSQLVSPKIGKAHGLTNEVEGNERVLLDEVKEVVSMIARRRYPHEFLEKYYPAAWGAYTPEMPDAFKPKGLTINNPVTAANVVHMDNVMDLAVVIMRSLLRQGVQPKVRDTNHDDFLNRVPDGMARIAVDIDEAMHKAFEAKYFFGVPRPEELDKTNMTLYPEGCPCHPSFPAGHGTAAGATAKAIIDHYELTDAQIKEVRDCCYLWGMFRSFAGVHYAVDNLAGLHIAGLDEVDYSFRG